MLDAVIDCHKIVIKTVMYGEMTGLFFYIHIDIINYGSG